MIVLVPRVGRYQLRAVGEVVVEVAPDLFLLWKLFESSFIVNKERVSLEYLTSGFFQQDYFLVRGLWQLVPAG